MQNGELYLILGCFGRSDFDKNLKDFEFVSCSGCENKILKVDDHLDHYNEIMDYFDSCRLFDRPMFEYNAIAHFIKNIQDRFDQITSAKPKRLWKEMHYHLFQKFLSDHRLCGLYVKLALILPEENESAQLPEKGVIVKSEAINAEDPKFKLSLVRGRR